MLERKIDKTTRNDIVKRMYNMVPYFTPEWKFDLEEMDPGAALFKLFLDMHMETIDLFNQVYEKNYVSFLNLFDTTLLKPNASRAPIVFVPSAGASEHTLVDAGTKILARKEDVIGFTTEGALEVLPIKLKKLIMTNGREDKMIAFDGDAQVSLFDFSGENIQSHELYISEDNVLYGSNPTDFHISFEGLNSKTLSYKDYKRLADKNMVTWQYFSGDQWHTFDEASVMEKNILLEKKNFKPIEIIQEGEFESQQRWLRLLIKNGCVNDYLAIKIGKIAIKPVLRDDVGRGILADKVYNNDKNLDVSDLIMPFGNSFYDEDCFYLTCDDVLSKADALITLSFDLCYNREPLRNEIPNIDWKLIIKQSELNRFRIVDIKIRSVRWEYWNGQSWQKLDIVNGEKVFSIEKNKRISLKFQCPRNIKKFPLNGEENYYIRAVIKGVDNNFATYGRYLVPNIHDTRLVYDYNENHVSSKNCLIKNNNLISDMTEAVNSHLQEFYPFQGIKEKENTVFMCFDKPFGKGPNSMLFVMEEERTDSSSANRISMSYLKMEKNNKIWKSTEFEDQTNLFNRTGHFVLGNINEMIQGELFGETGYWLKCEFNTSDMKERMIQKILMNSVWARQEEVMLSERFNVPKEEESIELSQMPVLKEWVWVNEFSSISLGEINDIKANEKYIEVLNDYEEREEFWVLWQKTNDILSEKAESRVYVIDPISGVIRFGNDVNGKRIPWSNSQQVSVDYNYGGGSKGNLQTNEIANLDHAIAYIDSVYNPIAAVGGSDHETFDAAVERSSNRIRNRDRGVTIKDIESIAKSASRNILNVKCVPNLDNQYQVVKGNVAVLVIPNRSNKEKLSIQLKGQIFDYLVERCPAQIAGSIHVSDPIYVTISVYGRFISKDKLAGRMVHDEIKKRMDAFIDIKNGNFHGEGWDIGKLPNEIMLHSILSEIDSIQRIMSLNIFYTYEDHLGKHTIRSENLGNPRFMIVNNGEYNVEINQKV